MVNFKISVLASSALLASQMLASASPVISTEKAGKAWSWMWGNPPDSNYITTSLHTCSVGNVFNRDNVAAKHIKTVQIFSDKGAISGLHVTYADDQAASYGRLIGEKSSILNVPVDKWISDIDMGCTGGLVSYLSLATTGGQKIEVGSIKGSVRYHYNTGAVFQFLGAVGPKGLTAFGANDSEPEGPDDE